ncbi:MAG: acetyl-CoA carboxylase, biotin carboxyl carrier protein [Thiotrichales bacterium]|nr:acetyl-CoA carboxylase, biotin carboxyl carrier protein [Thiotrichales bacterium]|tara:strand:- start:909 stop:1454 length:546 start_codon:yes stop_codon:yes gene_type:complete
MAADQERDRKDQALGYRDVLDILDIVDGISEGGELTVDVGDFHLHFVKDGTGAPARTAGPSTPVVATPVAAESDAPVAEAVAAASPEPSPAAEPETQANPDWYEVKSPMVGTFYRRPAPDQPPFVEVGQEVGAEDAVCLVEVMKLFNTIQAGQTGRIAEICVEDAAPVAVGQVLMRMDPST